ncbi:ribokinase [Phytohalomonas tamaricis]|uniref:ribokinase n=1 Tax=Phytohalomonas tamaricis TaxID=2081032 RepID=UPI000D0AED70|nr:ribokinase [Phytohalomonas tamaricis]
MLYNYGSINIDHVYRVPHLVRPGETLSSLSYRQVLGGKGSNQTIAVARAGGNVMHWGRLGRKDRWVLETLTSSGANIAHIEIAEEASGHTVIQVDDEGENSIVLYPGANHGFSRAHLEALFSITQPGEWLLLQNECNATDEVLALAHQHGMKIAFNPAPMNAEVRKLPLEHVDVLFLNRGEAAMLLDADDNTPTEALLDQLEQRFPATEIVLTLGAEGVAYRHGESRLQIPAQRVEAVDTTGAGDTFIGYFMAARLAQAPIETCLQRATTAAALCVQREGAAPSIPTTAELEQVLAQQPPHDVLTSSS